MPTTMASPHLRIRGAQMVDDRGAVVQLRGVNWFGFNSGTTMVRAIGMSRSSPSHPVKSCMLSNYADSSTAGCGVPGTLRCSEIQDTCSYSAPRICNTLLLYPVLLSYMSYL